MQLARDRPRHREAVSQIPSMGEYYHTESGDATNWLGVLGHWEAALGGRKVRKDGDAIHGADRPDEIGRGRILHRRLVGPRVAFQPNESRVCRSPRWCYQLKLGQYQNAIEAAAPPSVHGQDKVPIYGQQKSPMLR